MDCTGRLLLDGVHYFQVVFTLPSEPSSLALGNRQAIYNLLFQAAWSALRETIAAEQRYEPAALMVLHTWNQKLESHAHVHAVVPGGGDERQIPITLSTLEFTRRWALHVLPAGFTKTRHFGGWSNCRREAYLDHCLRLLDAAPLPLAADASEFDRSTWEISTEARDRCPTCGAALQLVIRDEEPSWRDVMQSRHRPAWYTARKVAGNKLLSPTGFG